MGAGPQMAAAAAAARGRGRSAEKALKEGAGEESGEERRGGGEAGAVAERDPTRPCGELSQAYVYKIAYRKIG